jgi:hypothetical protein
MLATTIERPARLLYGRSKRPALTHLAWLVAADPRVAERLLQGESIEAAVAHPHYAVNLDARDRATLADICMRTCTVHEFLVNLALVAEGGSF